MNNTTFIPFKNENLKSQLIFLINALAREYLLAGDKFLYYGEQIYSDEIAEHFLNCFLAHVQIHHENQFNIDLGLRFIRSSGHKEESFFPYKVYHRQDVPLYFSILSPIILYIFNEVFLPMANETNLFLMKAHEELTCSPKTA